MQRFDLSTTSGRADLEQLFAQDGTAILQEYHPQASELDRPRRSPRRSAALRDPHRQRSESGLQPLPGADIPCALPAAPPPPVEATDPPAWYRRGAPDFPHRRNRHWRRGVPGKRAATGGCTSTTSIRCRTSSPMRATWSGSIHSSASSTTRTAQATRNRGLEPVGPLDALDADESSRPVAAGRRNWSDAARRVRARRQPAPTQPLAAAPKPTAPPAAAPTTASAATKARRPKPTTAPAAAAPPHRPRPPPAKSCGQTVKLRYALWDESFLPIVQPMFKDFTAKNPNVTVEPEIQPFDDHFTKLQREFAGAMRPMSFTSTRPMPPRSPSASSS